MAAITPVRAWIAAARPPTLTAVVAPILMGLGLARHDERWLVWPAVATLVAGLLIQIGTNIANDYYDYLKGADTAERLGGVRVTQAGLLSARAVRRGMWVVFGTAVAVGAYLVTVGGWPILAIGLVSIAAGVGYTAGPTPIGYVGLGDLFTFVFFGPVAVVGTYYLQSGTVTWGAAVAGCGIGALVTAILVVNNLRDIDTDAGAGKRTLAVRIGRAGSRAEYLLLLATGAAIPLLGWSAGLWDGAVAVVSAVLLTALPTLRTVLTFTNPRDLNAALGQTARMVGLYGLAFAATVAR
ncbi:MAG TPA: 1,4-dihydroxy-2-naphthoate polyprenyltransferase [Gemmatimonadales bacterium]